jgi:hypothetical protein
MTKRGKSTQLDLNLSEGKKPQASLVVPARVVPFVDAATREVRRKAVQRVASSGIFYLDPTLRKQG